MKNIKGYRDLILENVVQEGQTELDWDLIQAVRRGKDISVRNLLSRGANPNCMIDQDTPLSWAAQKSEVRIMKDLLEAGADPKIEVPRWNMHVSVLCMAVDLGTRSSTYQMMEMLLEAGANPDGRDTNGRTPLAMLARTSDGNWNRYDLLFGYGADPNIPDYWGRVPLDWPLVYMTGSDEKIVKTLILNGADPFKAEDGPKRVLALFKGDLSWMPEGAMKDKLTRTAKVKNVFGK